MSISEYDLLTYIDELIQSNDIELALKLIIKLPNSQKYEGYSHYLNALCIIKQIKDSSQQQNKQNHMEDYKKAYSFLDLIQEYNKNIEYLKIFCLYNLNDYEEIIELYIRNKNDYEDFIDVLLIVALSYEKMNLFKGAKKVYKLIFSCQRQDETERKSVDDKKSIDNLSITELINKAYNNYIALLLRSNDLLEVSQVLNQININKINPELANNIAIFYILQGKSEEGLCFFENILTGEDEFVMDSQIKCKILNNYINQLVKLGYYDKAEGILLDNYVEDPSGIQVLLYLDMKLKSEGETKAKEKEIYSILKTFYDYNKEKDIGNTEIMSVVSLYMTEYSQNQHEIPVFSNENDTKSKLKSSVTINKRCMSHTHLPSIKSSIGYGVYQKEKYNNLEEEIIEEMNNIHKEKENDKEVNNEDELVVEYNSDEKEEKEEKEGEENSLVQTREGYVESFNKVVSNREINTFFDEIKKTVFERMEKENEKQKETEKVKENPSISKQNSIESMKNTANLNNISYQTSKANTPKLPSLNFNKENENENENEKILPKDSEDSEEEQVSSEISFLKQRFEKGKKENFSFSQLKTEIKSLLSKKINQENKFQLDLLLSLIANEENDYITISNILYGYYKILKNEHVFLLINSLKCLNLYSKLTSVYEFMYYTNNKSIEYAWEVINYSVLSNNYELLTQFGLIILSDQTEHNKNLSLLIENVFKGGPVFNDYLDSLIDQYKRSTSSQTEGNHYYFLSGRNNLRKKNNNSAFEYFLRIENDPTYINSLSYLKAFAKTCIKLKNNKKALKLYKSGLKLNNTDFECCLSIGECYLKLENIEKAMKYLSFCKGIDCSSEEKNKLYFALGRLLYKQKDYFQSIEHFQKCIQSDPSSYRSFHNIALIYMEINQTDKAKEFFEKCIQIQPNYYIASFEILTIDLKEAEEKERAGIKDKFDQIINQLPSQFLDYSKILIEYFKNTQEAIYYINKSLNIKEINVNRVIETTSLLLKEEKLQEAYEIFSQILKKTEKDLKTYLKVCNFYNKIKKFSFSIKILKSFLVDNPNHFNALCELSFYYLKDFNFQSALKYFQEAEDLYNIDIKYNGFLKGIAYCYLELHLLDKAFLEMSKHNNKLSEENNNLIMAYVKSLQGNDVEASLFFNNEVELFPNNALLRNGVQVKDLKGVKWRELFKFY